MLFAIGWVVVRSSREPYLSVLDDPGTERFGAEIDRVDDQVDRADEALFRDLEDYLRQHTPPDLEWHFRRDMNNVRGILQFASSRNHRGEKPTVIELLRWIERSIVA